MTKLLSYTKTDFGQEQNSFFKKTKSESLANKNILIKQDTFYKNFKLENKVKTPSDKNIAYNEGKKESSNLNNSGSLDFIYGTQTLENDPNSIGNRTKYSNPDVSDKKRINLFINRISSNDSSINENVNYKTSVNFYKNIKINSSSNNNFKEKIQENKNISNAQKTHSRGN